MAKLAWRNYWMSPYWQHKPFSEYSSRATVTESRSKHLYLWSKIELFPQVLSQLQTVGYFFYLGFFSRTFMIYRTVGEEGGYFFKSSQPLPLTSQTLRRCWVLQNHCVAPTLTQPFIFPRSVKQVRGISGNLVVKSKLLHRSGSSLEADELHP